jgi:hypothetical protein
LESLSRGQPALQWDVRHICPTGLHVQLVPRSWANFALPQVPKALSTTLAPVPSPRQAGTEPAGPVGSWDHCPRWPREALPQVPCTSMPSPAILSLPGVAIQGEAWLGCYTQQELESYAGVLPVFIVGTGWDSVSSTGGSVKRTQRLLLLEVWNHL